MKLLPLLCLVPFFFVGCVKSTNNDGIQCADVILNPTESDVPYQDGTVIKFASAIGSEIEQNVIRSSIVEDGCYRRETVRFSNSENGFTALLNYPSSSPGRLIYGSFTYEEGAEPSGASWYINASGEVGPDSPLTDRIIVDTIINGLNYKLLGVIPNASAELPTDMKNLYYHPENGVVLLEWVDRPSISLTE